MTEKVNFYTKDIFSRDVCKSCKKRDVSVTKTKYEKSVEKFNQRYGKYK